jgi:hypothetical protein
MYRKERPKWVYEMLKGDDIVEINSIGVSFPLPSAYEDVDFEEDFSEDEGDLEDEEELEGETD